jgi:hypothetical protein
MLIIALPSFAFQWEYLGMDGVSATTLTVDPEHNRVYVGTYEGFWFFDQGSSLWTERDDEGWIGRTVWAVDYHDDLPHRVITGRENAWFKGYMEYSDDLGLNGNFVYESTGGRVTDALHLGDHHLACTWSDIAPGELLYSNTGGTSWAPIAGHGFHAMTDMDPSLEGALFLSGDAGVKASWDFGQSWDAITGDLPAGYGIYCVASAYPGGDVIPWPSVFASNDLGIYYSDHPGVWIQKSTASSRRIINIPGQFLLSPDDLAAVSWDGRVLHSTNFGDNWNDETGDLPGTPIDAAFSANGFDLYVLTSTRGLYRYSDLETSVDPAPSALATLNAFPNPFNPKTTLDFTLPAAGMARLEIFDAGGRRVARVINELRPAGRQSVDWNAEALPSGVYLANLVSGEFESSTRLVLLK